ncbi:cobalamin B12-binding domain-containing protein [Myxococcus sp. AM011]|uniref:B12-binding domain-containing radical SAM protein n=1 Tax=Myxococcus sp. AM011 TaxID=2745200 RepID=UPI001596212E|nr:radical SAM protein [Myxococcus sp. AM011]NVJ26192.1 cobalamin B12-binding domain-containing protein [Myxococcus sp. AM011]
MKVLLLYPNARRELIGWGDLGAIAEPLALEYLAAGARQDGHEVRLLDLRLHPHDLMLTLWSFEPDVVGVTGYSMHVLRMLELCRQSKGLLPNVRTVVGGHHATLMPEDFFEPQVDCVVSGEGVRPFRRILQALEAGEGLGGIPGAWARDAGDTFRFGGAPPQLDIDALPFPDRSLVPEDRGSYFIDWMKPIALLRTTVGCPFRCNFCSLWKIMDGRYYKRDVEHVVAELATIPERYVFLVDDEPFVNPRRMWALAEQVEAARMEKEFFAYCRIDSFLRDLDLMRRWRDIGLRRVFFGLEAVLDHELKDYNKRQAREQIVQGLQAARELGIHVFASFIVKPEYTPREFDQLAAFIREHGVDYPSFTLLTPLPGTPACESFENILERQPNGRPQWEHFDLQHAVTRTRMPREEFMREYRKLQGVFSASYRAARHPLFQDSEPGPRVMP